MKQSTRSLALPHTPHTHTIEVSPLLKRCLLVVPCHAPPTFMVSWLTNTVRWSRVSSSIAARLAASSLSSFVFSERRGLLLLRLRLRLLLTLERRLLRRESSCGENVLYFPALIFPAAVSTFKIPWGWDVAETLVTTYVGMHDMWCPSSRRLRHLPELRW